jgi:hypothetical protein
VVKPPSGAFADARGPYLARSDAATDDLRCLLASRSGWAILALAAGDAGFVARVADGLAAQRD